MNRLWEIEFIEEAPKPVLNVSIPITLKNYSTPKKLFNSCVFGAKLKVIIFSITFINLKSITETVFAILN